MHYSPSYDEFAALAREHTVVPVYRQLIGDTLTPVSAFCKVQEGDWSFLFESVVGGERIGRYSFVGAGPFLRFQAWGNRVQVTAEGRTQELDHPDPIQLLQEHLSRYRAPAMPGLPRFCGGAVGYAAYDSVRYTERLPNAPYDDRQLPDLCFAFFDRMVIFDHLNKTIAVVAHVHVTPPTPPSQGGEEELKWSYREACKRVDQLVERLQQNVADLQLTDIDTTSPPLTKGGLGGVAPRYKSNFTRPAFENAVRKCQEYIKAGDIFQVVISQRLQTETRARPFDIYRALRVINPSPFMFFLRAGNHTLVGSSPEVMVRVEGDKVTTRPLAGTRRRGGTETEDERLAQELLADPKERAEHIMLVDLGRNDIGRVSQYGTVELSDVMVIERYSHVMHISSNVTGRIQGGKTALDALRACLPAGTLSGAPKVRAMEIIDELEPHRRGPYGGAVGYVDFSGNMDTCIALRTLVLKGQTAYLQAGAGIVADSVPAQEYEETISKAMGLLRAIEIAETQL
jgi:anthranilate synthase component I